VTFTSLQYAGFLAAVVLVNWAVPVRFRPSVLLIASLAFYASWSVPALGILGFVCLVAWGAGLLIPRFEGSARVAITGVAVLAATGSLLTFKLLEAVGVNRDGAGLVAKLVVPVGLSFFSFQAISYVVDVHRREIRPHRSPIDVSLYLSFFPHLLAGPIVRAKKLIPKFHETPRTPNWVQWSEAAELVLVGVFKKVVLADPLVSQALDPARHPGSLGPAHAFVLMVGILVGGYYDITGYIDIARGSAKFLGIDMQRNSLSPLLKSTGYADFWRRWQLTVMMWFRDYVYRPLRRDGSSRWLEDGALFGTFFALGVWHGLTMGWALWGVASGLIIIGERTLQTKRATARRAQTKAARAARSKAMLPKPPSAVRQLVIALALVMVTFPLVAAKDLHATAQLYAAFMRFGGSKPSADLLWITALALVAVPFLDHREARREAKAGKPDPVTFARAVAFGLMVLGVIVFSGPAPQTFLYFNF
jgi:alginate O-acetyltransferase complex protein AlgI